ELTDGQGLPLAEPELLGLEGGEDAVADHLLGELRRVGREGRLVTELLQVSRQARRLDDTTLLDKVDQVGIRGRRWHRPPFRGRRAGRGANGLATARS